MISNRDKIEREILHGRQYVRTALNDQSNERKDVTPRKHAYERKDSSQSIPIDSDAESGYNRASVHNSPSKNKYKSEASLGLGSGTGSSPDRPRPGASGRSSSHPRKKKDGYGLNDHSTDSGTETLFPAFNFGSSIRRLRTQSFPAMAWSKSPKPPGKKLNSTRTRTKLPPIKPNDSSSSEDDDELRVVEAATRGRVSSGE